MLELTKTPHTDDFVEIRAIVPMERLHAVELAIQEAAEPSVPWREVFPDFGPAEALRGARGLRGLTQAQLAEKIGAHKVHISEMERGKRTIGVNMAKRLGKALDFPYKVFL
jgi:antitoxin component HigA of HigAB toxin-antitoxin module